MSYLFQPCSRHYYGHVCSFDVHSSARDILSDEVFIPRIGYYIVHLQPDMQKQNQMPASYSLHGSTSVETRSDGNLQQTPVMGFQPESPLSRIHTAASIEAPGLTCKQLGFPIAYLSNPIVIT